MRIKLISLLPLTALLCTSYLHTSSADRAFTSTGRNSVVTNEAFIRGLARETDVGDPVSVFRYVFSSMEDEVKIYPTENYYYFECGLGGVHIKGNIGLFADSIDKGLVSFTYEEAAPTEDPDHPPLEREVDLTAQDGVSLRKVSDFKYTISFEGKTVTFNLNDIGLAPPRKVVLSPDETFVGPSFDESGLQFCLIYHRKCNTLFWILNEDDYVPETFRSYSPTLLIGRRTEFAFYDDRTNSRRILIGVKKENVNRNNWYDGPFDQLPDNYIKTGRVELKKYIEACYPYTKGRIDEYGGFLNRNDARVAIAPYLQYSSERQLAKLITSIKATSTSKSDFYCRLSRTR